MLLTLVVSPPLFGSRIVSRIGSVDSVYREETAQISHPFSFQVLQFWEVLLLGTRVSHTVKEHYLHTREVSGGVLVVPSPVFAKTTVLPPGPGHITLVF